MYTCMGASKWNGLSLSLCVYIYTRLLYFITKTKKPRFCSCGKKNLFVVKTLFHELPLTNSTHSRTPTNELNLLTLLTLLTNPTNELNLLTNPTNAINLLNPLNLLHIYIYAYVSIQEWEAMIRKNCDENIRPYNFDPMNYVIESGQFSIEFVLYKMHSVQFWSVELYMCSLYVFFRRLHEAPRDGGAHAQDDWVEYTVPPGRWLHSGSNSPSSSSFYHHHHLFLLLTWSIQCLQDAGFTGMNDVAVWRRNISLSYWSLKQSVLQVLSRCDYVLLECILYICALYTCHVTLWLDIAKMFSL